MFRLNSKGGRFTSSEMPPIHRALIFPTASLQLSTAKMEATFQGLKGSAFALFASGLSTSSSWLKLTSVCLATVYKFSSYP